MTDDGTAAARIAREGGSRSAAMPEIWVAAVPGAHEEDEVLRERDPRTAARPIV